MSQEVFVTYEPIDGLFTNIFTDESEAEKWTDSDKMGSDVLGPFTVESEQDTPFEVVLEAHSTPLQVADVYVEADIPDSADTGSLYGPYTVYTSVEEFQDSL